MSIINKFFTAVNSIGEDDDEYDDAFLEEYNDDIEDEYAERKSNKVNFFNKPKKPSYDEQYDEVEMPAQRRATSGGVRVIKPASVDDGREICETLLDGNTVILNVEGLDLEIAQRIIDFTSGATYSIKGNLQKISSSIFLVTPSSVDISGDLQDILSGSFDVSSIRNRY